MSIDLIGAFTVHTVGKRTACNTAVAIVTALRFAADKHPRRATRVVLRELPDVERDRDARDLLVLQAEQALAAPVIVEETTSLAPNEAFDGNPGNCTLVRFDFHQPLERFIVAEDVARSFSTEITAILATPLQPLVESLQFHSRRAELFREPTEKLIERAFDLTAEELFASATARAYAWEFRVHANLTFAGVLNLSDASTEFSHPPKTTNEAKERLALQAACINALNRAHDETELELAAVADELADAERFLKRCIATIHPNSLFSRVVAAFSSVEKALGLLGEAIDSARALIDTYAEIEAKLFAIQSARALVVAEEEFLRNKLSSIRDELLSRLISVGQTQRPKPFVIAAPLDSLFTRLWDTTPTVPHAELARLLGLAVQEVTLEGLAQIVGAEPRLDAIAARIASREVSVVGPPWGGRLRFDPRRVTHVLPPIEHHRAESLRQMILDRDPKSKVAVARYAVAAVNVVDIHWYAVNHPSDALTSYYEVAYLVARRDPNAALFGVSAETEKELGMEISGESVTFVGCNGSEE
jgi:hypothetical protein